MFKICTHQLRRSFTTPRIYIAFMIGIVLQIISVIPILEFSQYLNKPLSVFEGFVYFTCDDYLMAACFLGIVVLVADAPFAEKKRDIYLTEKFQKEVDLGQGSILTMHLLHLLLHHRNFRNAVYFK